MANTAINHDPAATFPGSSTDTAVVKWSGSGGKTLANSGVTIDGSNNLTVPGNITTTGYVHLTGDTQELRFYENGNFIAIKAPSLGADYTLTLPINDGAASEFLQTDGNGVLVWAAAGGDLSFGGDTFDSDKVIGSNNAYDFGFETAGVTRMDITDDGKVGIGTIVPTELLSVNGTGTGITGTTVSTFSTQQDFNPRRGVMLGYDSSGQIGIISATTSAAAADLAFWSYNSGWSEKMRLKANGEFTIKSGSNMTSVTKGVATVFVKMSGSGSVTQSTNVASVTKGATGVYTVNFTTNQSGDNTYAAVVSAAQAAGSQDNAGYHIYSASTAAFGAYHIVDGGTTTHVDLPNSVVIYGSLA